MLKAYEKLSQFYSTHILKFCNILKNCLYLFYRNYNGNMQVFSLFKYKLRSYCEVWKLNDFVIVLISFKYLNSRECYWKC